MTDHAGRLDKYQRRNYAIGGCLLLALLGLAAFLTPDASGYGTHRQLGLPPCTFRSIFRMHCPTCGMTTSWSHLMRGNLGASVRANAGGTCLALLTAAGGVWAILVAYRGIVRPRLPRCLPTVACSAVVAVIVVDWGLKFL